MASLTLSPRADAATPCDRYGSAPTPAQRRADLARARAQYPEAKKFSPEGYLNGGDFRFAWLRSDGMEPGVFLFQGQGSRTKFLAVWGGVLAGDEDRRDAERWATKLGAPAQLSQCFVDKLSRDGP